MTRRFRVAVTGTTGRVGRALADRLGGAHEVIELPRTEWDFAAPDAIASFAALDFDLLINPAAITSVDRCEENPALARRVNAEVPAALARLCRRRGAKMLHFSTDYVLDGARPGLLDESAPVGPLGEYGRTKLAAERAVLEAGGCVLRVSWVFGPERPAFPDQVFKRALAGEPVAAVADKTSMPCFTADLAGWVERLLELGLENELLHVCNGGEPASWFDMARCVLGAMHERGALETLPEVEAQRMDELPRFRAPRPRHTAMSTARLALRTGRTPRPWTEAMREYVNQLLVGFQSR